ncbi:TonB-dependent receptor [soil metagenome]
MTRQTKLVSGLALLFATGSLPGTALAQSEPQATTLDEVVVTAQKREQRLQDVPVSATVLGQEQLQTLQIASGSDIARQTPNLRVSVLGNEDQPKFSLRGIATAEFNLNAVSPTGIFYDEVYVASSFLGGPQLFDMERVEVLRGPQGTLFGKNTTGGAVNFITRRPDFTPSGELSAQAGNNDYYHVDGAFGGPLSDRFAARIAFTASRSDGWQENANPAGSDLSSTDTAAARLSLRYRDESTDATLRLFTARSSPKAIGAINYGLGPGGTNAFGVNPRINPYTGEAFDSHQGAYDRSGDIDVKGDGGYLTVNHDIRSLTLTSITSYLTGSFSNLVDGDGSIADLLHIDFLSDTSEFAQDLRLSTNSAGPFNAIAGVYYFHDDIDIQTKYRLFSGAAVLNQSYNQKRSSVAAYADGTWDVSPEFTVYGGLRWTQDEGKITGFQVVPAIPRQPDIGYDDGDPTGRLGVRYHPSDHLMLYAQYARGYRSSAINGGALTNPADLNVAEPETLDSWEAGVKTTINDRIRLNASVFTYDFTNQQFINVVGIGNQQLVNAGQSRVTGLELEVTAAVTDRFQLSGGLGLLDTEYETLVLQGVDLSGNELIEAPNVSANMAADYRLPLAGGELSLHADATYVGDQYFSAFNDTPPFDTIHADSFWESNARIAFKPANSRFEVSAWIKNIGDNDEITGAQIDPTTATVFTTVPYPRRYGVGVSYRY